VRRRCPTTGFRRRSSTVLLDAAMALVPAGVRLRQLDRIIGR
jgi:hypothetical protein